MHTHKEREKEWARESHLKEKSFSSSPTPIPLRWRSINLPRFIFITRARRTFKRKLGVCEQAIKVLKGLWHPMRMCGIFISGLAEPFFKIGFWWKNPLPSPEKAIISVFKSHLVNFGSFKRHILYFCASIVEKIRSHWGEVHEGILFSFFCCQCSYKGIKCGVYVGHLAFICVCQVLHSTIQLFRWGLNVKYVKKVEKGFLDTAVDYKWDSAASEADLRHDFRLSATI